MLLPVLAQNFGLNYSQVGMIRAISNVATSVLEIPSGILAEKFGEKRLIVFGLICAGAGYFGVAQASDYAWILFFFLIAGIGAGFQHSLSSSILVGSFAGAKRREVMGVFNASGDMGKLAYTGIFSLFVGIGIHWNHVVTILAVLTIFFGIMVTGLLEKREVTRIDRKTASDRDASFSDRWGIKHPGKFAALGTVVFLDSVVQIVFLTFLAFVLLDKNSSDALAGSGVVLALAGGMVGKYVAGYLAARFGDKNTFILLQILTITGIVILLTASLFWLLVALPLIGIAVQGSSTITYGSVSDFVTEDKQTRGYALIYSLSNGSVVGPFIFGWIADLTSLHFSIALLVGLMLVTLVFCNVLSSQHTRTPQ
ncbi:MAG: MFS transporter [Pseudomonadota bacterium]